MQKEEGKGMKDDTRGNALLVVAICLITITTAFVAARLWARFVMLRKAGLDDYTIIPAYVCTTESRNSGFQDIYVQRIVLTKDICAVR